MIRRRVLGALDRVAPAAAWCLVAGGAATFVAVLVGIIATGDAKWATLLVAADLTVGGYSQLRDEQRDDEI